MAHMAVVGDQLDSK